MIGRLRGELIVKQPPHLLVDVNGVGYELEAPMSTFYGLPQTGEAVSLLTHLLVREDAQILYAFATSAERELFRALLKVNGVGARMALAILSGMDVKTFRSCVHEGNTQALVRLPGVGRKTAERLVIEMRDRLDALDITTADFGHTHGGATERPHNPVEDAVSALISLGYKPPDASRMVSRIDTEQLDSETIIRRALRESLGA